jgi:hypothetical protein
MHRNQGACFAFARNAHNARRAQRAVLLFKEFE